MFPPRKRDCLTRTQLDVLVIFYEHHTRKNGRKKRPTLTEIGLQLGGPPISKYGVRQHLYPLVRRGLLEQRAIYERRGYELTKAGITRARARVRTMAKHEAKELEKIKRHKQAMRRLLKKTKPKRTRT
jgi:predicted ArsR family transcriptional regulator